MTVEVITTEDVERFLVSRGFRAAHSDKFAAFHFGRELTITLPTSHAEVRPAYLQAIEQQLADWSVVSPDEFRAWVDRTKRKLPSTAQRLHNLGMKRRPSPGRR